MKVIDLIYKIANGEEVPQKIIYEDELYEFREDLHDYENKYPDFEAGIDKYKYLFEDPYGRDYKEFLNDEVEVIEEDKKIEELFIRERANDILIGRNEKISYATSSLVNKELADKINEIIDFINGSDKE